MVYQFHGCFWHGHHCDLNGGKEVNEKHKKPMVELLEETRANTEYICSKGYRVVEMWVCEWWPLKRSNRELQHVIAMEVHRTLDTTKIMSLQRTLSEVRNERLFGCVEVDISVPDHLKEKFSEMCLIFKNTEIRCADIGDFMKSYAEEHNIMAQPRCSLIGSMKEEKFLLATPLPKWYLEHGLVVTRIHQVVEFTPEPCCKPFGDAVSDTRRAGDTDPRKAIIAFTMKLVSFLFHFSGYRGGEVYFIFRIRILFIKCTIFSFCICIFLYLGGQFRLRKNHYKPAEAQERGILLTLLGVLPSRGESHS